LPCTSTISSARPPLGRSATAALGRLADDRDVGTHAPGDGPRFAKALDHLLGDRRRQRPQLAHPLSAGPAAAPWMTAASWALSCPSRRGRYRRPSRKLAGRVDRPRPTGSVTPTVSMWASNSTHGTGAGVRACRSRCRARRPRRRSRAPPSLGLDGSGRDPGAFLTRQARRAHQVSSREGFPVRHAPRAMSTT